MLLFSSSGAAMVLRNWFLCFLGLGMVFQVVTCHFQTGKRSKYVSLNYRPGLDEATEDAIIFAKRLVKKFNLKLF